MKEKGEKTLFITFFSANIIYYYNHKHNYLSKT